MRKITFTTKQIAYLAILVAISVVLNMVGIILPGYSTKLSFTYIPCFVAGIFMGPLAGLLVGFLGDVLGFLIKSDGLAWMPLITVASSLMGLIPGIICKYLKVNAYIKIAVSLAVVFVVCSVFINTYALFLLYSKGRTFWVYLGVRMPIQSIIFAANAAAILALYPPLNKFVFKHN